MKTHFSRHTHTHTSTDLGRSVYPDGSVEKDMVTELFEERSSVR